jgi:Rhodopirellula transposase DDE domain
MTSLQEKYELMCPELDERRRRLWAASEALALGRGGIATVAQATGLAESTIRRGQQELLNPAASASSPSRRVRRQGGGRKDRLEEDPTLVFALEALVEPTTRGDPGSPLRWTCKSTRRLAAELTRQGHLVSHTKVAQVLAGLGYSLQGTRKTKEGASHPDRNAQFEYINEQVQAFQRRRQPVGSVDAKKKELVGEFANGGREYQPQGRPERVRVYDFADKQLGKAIPYGIYDLTANCGWVSVGIAHDTAQFAVATLRRWWWQMGRKVYRQARELLITADGGGSNGSRCRLWKVEVQRWADELGFPITVCHFPPGTSKWNKIEHRLFCYITENWRGRPLINHEVIVSLIADTTTKAGLRIKAELDAGQYPTGLKVTDEQMRALNLFPADFHGEDWNYTIKPRPSK